MELNKLGMSANLALPGGVRIKTGRGASLRQGLVFGLEGRNCWFKTRPQMCNMLRLANKWGCNCTAFQCINPHKFLQFH